jgi:hypothetical protein
MAVRWLGTAETKSIIEAIRRKKEGFIPVFVRQSATALIKLNNIRGAGH